MASDIRTGSGWSAIQELQFRDWGSAWQTARDAWMLIPDPQVVVDPPLIWHHFYVGAPTEQPVPTFIGAGTIITPPQVRCEVQNPNLAHYNAAFELWSNDGAPTLLDSAATAPGVYGVTFQRTTGDLGRPVRFRAAFGAAGNYGPWSLWSSTYVIF